MCVLQLIDFGFREKVHVSTLRIIPVQFATLNPFVTSCFVANIQPAGGKKWTSTAKELFKVRLHINASIILTLVFIYSFY